MPSNKTKRIFQETSEAPVWYLQLWQALSVDLASENGIVSRIDKSGFLFKAMTTVMPVIASFLLIAPLVNTWQAIKNYYYANNKNLDKTLDLAVNIFMTATSVGVLAILLAGIVYFSPYILIGAMGVSLSYGLYNVIKHAYAAWCAHAEGDEDRRKQHLMAIPYHVILSILGGLGLLVQLNYAFNIVIFNGMFNIVQISDATYNVAQVLLYSFGFLITLGTMPAFARAIMQYNHKTWAFLSDPMPSIDNLIYGENGILKRIKKCYESSKAEPLKAILLSIPTVIMLGVEVVAAAALVAARLIAAALAPVQLLGMAVTKAINFFKDIVTPAPQIVNLLEDPIPAEKKDSTAKMMRDMLVKRHTKLKTDIEAEITHLQAQEATPKLISKLYFMRNLEIKLNKNLNSYDCSLPLSEIEAEAKEISPHLYQSFWRIEGRVEKIARHVEELDHGMEDAKRLGQLEVQGARV